MEKNKTPKTQAEVNKYLLDNPVKNPANLWDIEQVLQNDGLKLPEDVRVNSSGINCIAFTKWYEKPQYPKTYEECCKVLGADPSRIMVLSNRLDAIYEEKEHCYEMYHLYQLLICRDAYWKIAGEQMGLGKPWEPSANDECKTISLYYNRHRDCIDKCEGLFESNAILDFSTVEMRDAFFENFKDLIEICKELL